ncbi:MAG: hypothetical protein BWY54_00187 [Candidatus Dependentiae bacterium ADurb.Bin331]|nr:MAG: hypothetical protein BWY54_00187 [Candidatus Dependentiae bacterium ADurb.Bin331]
MKQVINLFVLFFLSVSVYQEINCMNTDQSNSDKNNSLAQMNKQLSQLSPKDKWALVFKIVKQRNGKNASGTMIEKEGSCEDLSNE